MKRLGVIAAICVGFFGNTWVQAGAAPDIVGNAEAGQAKSALCAACHGADGNSVNPQWPSLAGLGADYIAQQLAYFKSQQRNNAIMYPIAMTLSPQDMADIGAYYGSQKNTGLEADPSTWKQGEHLYRAGNQERGIPACMACHGPLGAGNEPAKWPALRGQHAEYVVTQLTAYASGERVSPSNAIMPTIAKRLTPDEMKQLASYVQGLR